MAGGSLHRGANAGLRLSSVSTNSQRSRCLLHLPIHPTPRLLEARQTYADVVMLPQTGHATSAFAGSTYQVTIWREELACTDTWLEYLTWLRLRIALERYARKLGCAARPEWLSFDQCRQDKIEIIADHVVDALGELKKSRQKHVDALWEHEHWYERREGAEERRQRYIEDCAEIAEVAKKARGHFECVRKKVPSCEDMRHLVSKVAVDIKGTIWAKFMNSHGKMITFTLENVEGPKAAQLPLLRSTYSREDLAVKYLSVWEYETLRRVELFGRKPPVSDEFISTEQKAIWAQKKEQGVSFANPTKHPQLKKQSLLCSS